MAFWRSLKYRCIDYACHTTFLSLKKYVKEGVVPSSWKWQSNCQITKVTDLWINVVGYRKNPRRTPTSQIWRGLSSKMGELDEKTSHSPHSYRLTKSNLRVVPPLCQVTSPLYPHIVYPHLTTTGHALPDAELEKYLAWRSPCLTMTDSTPPPPLLEKDKFLIRPIPTQKQIKKFVVGGCQCLSVLYHNRNHTVIGEF